MENKIKIYEKMQQRTDEWYAIRVGRVGGSQAISLTTTARMKTQIYKTVAEILTGKEEEVFVTQVMQEGIDKEPIAKEEYEKETFSDIREVGYITNSDYKYLGLSPDGLIGENGAIEIKSPLPKQHVKIVMDGVPTENRPQLAQYFLINEELDWIDFVSYCPEVKAKPLYIYRCYRKEFEKDIATLGVEYFKFKVKVEEALKLFK